MGPLLSRIGSNFATAEAAAELKTLFAAHACAFQSLINTIISAIEIFVDQRGGACISCPFSSPRYEVLLSRRPRMVGRGTALLSCGSCYVAARCTLRTLL